MGHGHDHWVTTVKTTKHARLCTFHNIYISVTLACGRRVKGNNYVFVRFQVLTVLSMKMAVFWDVALCSLTFQTPSSGRRVSRVQRIGLRYMNQSVKAGSVKILPWLNGSDISNQFSHLFARGLFTALMMRTASTSETSVNFYQTTWHNHPEDSHLN
jgi:hypothetical protein